MCWTRRCFCLWKYVYVLMYCQYKYAYNYITRLCMTWNGNTERVNLRPVELRQWNNICSFLYMVFRLIKIICWLRMTKIQVDLISPLVCWSIQVVWCNYLPTSMSSTMSTTPVFNGFKRHTSFFQRLEAANPAWKRILVRQAMVWYAINDPWFYFFGQS